MHFSCYVVFDAEGDKFRNKCIEDYITVSADVDMECGNTRNDPVKRMKIEYV